MDNLTDLENKLKLKFTHPEILRTALTHRSYLNEHKDISDSNERLEFLGDAVLQFLSSQFLYHQFATSPEGDLTNFRASLVCTPSLAEISKNLNFGQHLYLSRGEEETGGRYREYILANTFEAVLGAIFLDQGIDACRILLEKNLFPKMTEIIKNKSYKDYKSRFQEFSQEKFSQTPEYKEIESRGPDHDKTFLMGIYLGPDLKGQGQGTSKQKAEQEAARDALIKFGQPA